MDPVCLLSSLCSHLHGDSTPSGAGQPAQVSHPSPANPWWSLALGRPFLCKEGYREFLFWTPSLLCTNPPLSRDPPRPVFTSPGLTPYNCLPKSSFGIFRGVVTISKQTNQQIVISLFETRGPSLVLWAPRSLLFLSYAPVLVLSGACLPPSDHQEVLRGVFLSPFLEFLKRTRASSHYC